RVGELWGGRGAPPRDYAGTGLHVAARGLEVRTPPAIDVDRRSFRTRFARPTRRDASVIPPPRRPPIIKPLRHLRQITEPPAAKPREGLHDRGPVQDFVESLVDLRQGRDHRASHLPSVA